MAVVTYNSADVLPGFLEALPGAMHGVDDWQLVLVDNSSRDNTLDIIRDHPAGAIVVETGRNGGYAAGINAAICASPVKDCLLVSNPDIRPAAGSVARLLQVLQDPGTGIAVPRLVTGDGKLIPSLRREPSVRRLLGEVVTTGRHGSRWSDLGEVVRDPTEYERENVAAWASGPFMLIARDCLEAVGPWDESFFLYSEETDFALRARDAGYLLRYTPDTTVVHLEGEARVSPRLYSMLTVNRSRLYGRRHRPVLAAGFHTALVLREGVRAVRGGGTHRAALRALLRSSARPREVAARLAPQPGPQDWPARSHLER